MKKKLAIKKPATPARTEIEVVEVTQKETTFYIGKMRADILSLISYASVRGVDQEAGAVQRILNTRRITSIKEYLINVGHLPSAIVLNWTKSNAQYKDGHFSFANEDKSAQLIDGQHRVAGIRAAIQERPELAGLEVPVSIYKNLSTKQCADIFLSINTEQKPVARSLVFDLYGVADANVVDPAAARARDIATALNEDEDSPYRELIKFPGSPVRKGGIALSTVVTTIKPLVEEMGDFEQRGLVELETQKKVILNWLKVLQKAYGERWFENTNAFMFASGFSGAISFLRTKLLTACQDRKSFTTQTMQTMFQFDRADLIVQEEVKGKAGKEAVVHFENRILEFFTATASKDSFEV